MRNIMVSIAKRLREIPEESARLILKRAEVSDALHTAIDALKKREIELAGKVEAERNGDGSKTYPNESARAAEFQRRIAADAVYQILGKEVDKTRKELREIDARMESITRRHESDICMTSTAASLLKAGMVEDANEILAVYGVPSAGTAADNGTDAVQLPGSESPAVSEAQEKDEEAGLETGIFEVIEVRPGLKEGTYRAYCVSKKNGKKVAIYANNGQGETLAGAVGKAINVSYKKLDKGLFALSVSVAG